MLADALQMQTYDCGDYIIKHGEIGDRFYILSTGEVAVLGDGGHEVAGLVEGSSFGEQAGGGVI
jgi:CRP-like cAMP-binding protein